MNWRYFFASFLVTLIPGLIIVYIKRPKPVVLSTYAVQVANSPGPTLSPSPHPSPKAVGGNATPTPTPVLIPPLSSPEETSGFVERFAGQYGVDPNVLRHIAICESGFNPYATNGPYIGLYQFGPVTWYENRILIGEDPDPILRYSAEESVQTAAYLLATKGRDFWPNCKP